MYFEFYVYLSQKHALSKVNILMLSLSCLWIIVELYICYCVLQRMISTIICFSSNSFLYLLFHPFTEWLNLVRSVQGEVERKSEEKNSKWRKQVLRVNCNRNTKYFASAVLPFTEIRKTSCDRRSRIWKQVLSVNCNRNTKVFCVCGVNC